MVKAEIDVTGVAIYNYDGHTKTMYNGTYYVSYFAEILIDEWLPYFECHQCGRFDYCKYVKLKPKSKLRADDIKCGVIADIIRNFLNYTIETYSSLTLKEKQDYFDGLYNLQKFIYKTELLTGLLMNENYIIGIGDKHAPALFGDLVGSRELLGNVASFWKSLDKFSTVQCFLLVEGKTEKLFVEKLKNGGLLSFYNIKVDFYDGKANKRYKKIQLLLESYKKNGYKIFMQGDSDGSKVNIFNEHFEKGILDTSNSFQFDYDFESSIPKKLLYDCFKEFDLLQEISLKNFIGIVGEKKGSELKNILFESFDINLDKYKIMIAIMSARLLYKNFFWNDEKFYQTELGKFVRFLERI